jgi:hypothetical protein
MTRLTKQQGEKVYEIGSIPNGDRDRFVRAVEQCVATYRDLCQRKSAPAVGSELAQIEKCAWRALALMNRKAWRPGEFGGAIEEISARLRNLSPAAQEYLAFRNLQIRRDVVLARWPDSSDPSMLIDPVCFVNRNDQVLALQDLLGAFAAPVARKQGRGQPHKNVERALYHFLAAAYCGATGRAPSDSSTKFMAVCSEIKRIYQLDEWNPESLARSARRPRRRAR